MTIDYTALGLRIRERREQLGLTQVAFAELIPGHTQSRQGQIERGERRAVALNTYLALCLSLGWSPIEAMPWLVPKPKRSES